MTSALRTARLIGVVLLAALGWLLWPATIGGSTTYVVTHGISMQPRFSTGDLAVLRTAGSYGIGDVVAYSSPTLGTTVMHRIVALDGDAFVTQGDNNSWHDPDHPTTAQIQGRLWLRVPHGGAALAQLQQPWTLVLFGLAGSAIAWTLKPRGTSRHGTSRHGRRGRTPRTFRAPTLPVLPPALRSGARQAALACATVAVLAGAGEALLLTLPATQSDTKAVFVGQQARWDWSAPAVVGTTYPTGRISTGDPIYTRLAGPITVTLHDTVSAEGLTGLTGTLRLVLGVQAADGWHADVVAGAPAIPVGGTVDAGVVLDLPAAAGLVHRHTTEIGATGNTATLTVTPQVALTGSVVGRPFTAATLPPLAFTTDGIALRPKAEGAALTPSASSTVPVPVTIPRHLQLGSVDVPLDVAGIAVGVLAVVAVAAAGACALAGRPGPGGPADDAPLRASGRLLPVRRFTPGRQVVDVEDGAALLRLAERLDLLVLHSTTDERADVFAVQDGDTTYRWTAIAAPAEQPAGRAALRVVTPVA